MKNTKQAFTLVELIVVITILAILGTIAFISLQGYSAQARDSKRLSDIQNIKKSLELFTINTGKYPLPDEVGEVKYEGDLVWSQGIVGDNISTNLSRNLNEKPIDPLIEIEYTYSTINSQTKYELLSIYESDLISYNNLLNQSNAASTDYPKIDGNYNGLFVKTEHYYFPTPSIITSELIGTELVLDEDNIKSQIITGGDNLPSVGIIDSYTGELDINLSVFTGSLDSESTVADRLEFITQLQGAYSGTTLANQTIYSDLLAITNDADKIENYVDLVVLNTGVYKTPVVSYSCLIEPDYTNAIFIEGIAIEVNQVWQNTDNLSPCYYECENDYSGDYCDIEPIVILYTSCKNILNNDSTKLNQDGIYTIDPENNGTGFDVYCDMTTDEGGWTMIGKQTNFESGKITYNSALRGSPLLLTETYNGTTQGTIINDISYTKMLLKSSSVVWLSIQTNISDFSHDSPTLYCRDMSLVSVKASSGIDLSIYKHIAIREDAAESLSFIIIGEYDMVRPVGSQCGGIWCSPNRHGRYNGSCQDGNAGEGNWMFYVR